jgi:hypothetical protein
MNKRYKNIKEDYLIMTTKNPVLADMLRNAQENKHSNRAPLIIKVKTQRMIENEIQEEKVINKIKKVAR